MNAFLNVIQGVCNLKDNRHKCDSLSRIRKYCAYVGTRGAGELSNSSGTRVIQRAIPQVDGKDLTSIINNKHENVKYLAGVKLPENIVAQPDLLEAVKGATLLVFVLPDNVRILRDCLTFNGY